MHTLTIKLKQHTPLIHFQHDQEGATLRASEVKPLLDKFVINSLIKKIGDDNYDTVSDQENEELIDMYEKKHSPNIFDDLTQSRQAYEIGKLIAYKKGLIKETANRPALDYKLTIIPNQKVEGIKMKEEPCIGEKDPLSGQSIYKTPDYPSKKNIIILGNIGGKTKDELLNFTQHESIDLKIISKHPDILTIIREEIQQFFLQNNFQNRKYRGFGSFTVTSIDGKAISTLPVPQNKLATLSFDISSKDKLSTWKGNNVVFNSIGTVWNTLRNNRDNRENRGLIKVFLGVTKRTNDTAERIPSPIYFKPIIDKQNNNHWEVIIHILSNKTVIKAGDCTEKDFTNLIMKNANFLKEVVEKYNNDSLKTENVTIIK